MVKIKLNLFEGILLCTFLPNIGFVFTSIILIISLIHKQEAIVYKGIIIAYLSLFMLIIISILLCLIVNKKSKKELILLEDEFVYNGFKYAFSQINFCEYYICKWYAIPIAFIYKQQVGGLVNMKLNTGEKIQFKVFYKDYLKIKNKIPNIIEK